MYRLKGLVMRAMSTFVFMLIPRNYSIRSVFMAFFLNAGAELNYHPRERVHSTYAAMGGGGVWPLSTRLYKGEVGSGPCVCTHFTDQIS